MPAVLSVNYVELVLYRVLFRWVQEAVALVSWEGSVSYASSKEVQGR